MILGDPYDLSPFSFSSRGYTPKLFCIWYVLSSPSFFVLFLLLFLFLLLLVLCLLLINY